MTQAPFALSADFLARRARLTASVALMLAAQLAIACTTGSAGARPVVSGRATQGIVEVTRGDLSAASTGSSLYSAIRYLRPALLASSGDARGAVPMAVVPAVYVNGIRAGDIEALRSIASDRVRRVEFLPTDDRRPYGFRYEPGAILVTLIADRP
jgi:hypothetical protein